MTLPIGSTLLILANPVHPRLAGQLGTVVSVTPSQPCRWATTRAGRKARCGNNPVLEVEGMGRVLLPKACVTVVEGVGMVA